jgi:hypothetical protein
VTLGTPDNPGSTDPRTPDGGEAASRLDRGLAGEQHGERAGERAGELADERGGALDVLVFYSPVEATEGVLAAVFAAGAGAIGDYTECGWVVEGMGQFRPGAGARPAIGEAGALERLPEHRAEVVLPRSRRRAVVEALRAAHPYEEPAFHVLETADPDADPT